MHTILFRLSNLVKQICYNNDKKIKSNIAIFENAISIIIADFLNKTTIGQFEYISENNTKRINKLRIPFFLQKYKFENLTIL